MGINLKIKILKFFIMKIGLNIIFLSQESHNKMELLKGKTKPQKKWPELFYMKKIFQNTFKLKYQNYLLYFEQSLGLSYFKENIYELWKGSYFYIFRCYCFILNNRKDNFRKLMPSQMRVAFQDIPYLVRYIKSLTNGPRFLKNQFM